MSWSVGMGVDFAKGRTILRNWIYCMGTKINVLLTTKGIGVWFEKQRPFISLTVLKTFPTVQSTPNTPHHLTHTLSCSFQHLFFCSLKYKFGYKCCLSWQFYLNILHVYIYWINSFLIYRTITLRFQTKKFWNKFV